MEVFALRVKKDAVETRLKPHGICISGEFGEGGCLRWSTVEGAGPCVACELTGSSVTELATKD